jgi:hypothetical protein
VNGPPADLAKGCRQAQLLGGALVGSIVVDAVIVELIRATRAPFTGFAPHVPIDTLRMVFIVLAVADLVAIRFVRAQMLGAASRGAAAVVDESDRARRLFTVSIVVLALCLAVAIYGLVLFLIGGRGLDFYTFAFVSLLAMAVHFPRLAQWEAWAKDLAPRG